MIYLFAVAVATNGCKGTEIFQNQKPLEAFLFSKTLGVKSSAVAEACHWGKRSGFSRMVLTRSKYGWKPTEEGMLGVVGVVGDVGMAIGTGVVFGGEELGFSCGEGLEGVLVACEFEGEFVAVGVVWGVGNVGVGVGDEYVWLSGGLVV